MKGVFLRGLFLIMLFLNAVQGIGQRSITSDDLLFMYQHNIHEDSTYMAQKGFEFYETRNTTHCQTMSWFWNHPEESQDSIPGPILFKMTCERGNKEIGYEFYDSAHFEELLTEIEKKGLNEHFSEKRNAGNYAEYIEGKHIIAFEDNLHPDGKKTFTVKVFNK